MTIGAMFAGIGGLELGLEAIGAGSVIWQAENNPYAVRVLEKNFPQVRKIADVRDIGETDKADLICGGFPCQDISTAGRMVGITGNRSGLWSEMVRVARLIKPRAMFIENVRALRSNGLDVVLKDLADVGFNAEWGCYTAREVGAPHERARLFILAYSDGYRLEADSHEKILCGEAIDNCLSGRFSQVGGEGFWSGTRPVGAEPVGVGNGVPRAVDRIRCLGNAVVPLQAAYAFNDLYRRINGQA